jgi:hypothetical protein
MMCGMRAMKGCAAVSLAAAAAGSAQAGIITLGASQDATLYESGQGLIANGAGQYIFAGRNNQEPSGFIRRGLVQFDLAGIVPEGAEITAARLVLNLSQLNGGPADVSLHRSLSPWTAGASDPSGNEGSGAPAGAGDATWLHSSFGGAGGSSSFWNASGGDFSAAASATVLTTGLGLYTWSSDALLADVRAFAASPSLNFGWFIIGPETTVGMTRRFDSSESGAVGGTVPRLEIEWAYVPAPAGAVPLAIGLAFSGLSRRRRR